MSEEIKSVDVYQGVCMCICSTPCPLGRRGMEARCTEKELREAGIRILPPPTTTKHRLKEGTNE